LDTSRLKGNRRHVLVAIASYAKPDGTQAFPSLTTVDPKGIGEKLGFARALGQQDDVVDLVGTCAAAKRVPLDLTLRAGCGDCSKQENVPLWHKPRLVKTERNLPRMKSKSIALVAAAALAVTGITAAPASAHDQKTCRDQVTNFLENEFGSLQNLANEINERVPGAHHELTVPEIRSFIRAACN
jgi:hypothetical protein